MNPSVQAHLLQARQCLASIASSPLTLREGLCLWNKAHAGRVTNIYRLTIVYTLAIRVLPALGEHPLAEICRMDRHQLTAAVPHWQQHLARGRMKEVLFGMKLLLIVVQWLHTEGRMARPRFLPLRERPVSRMSWRGDRPTCQPPRVMAKPIPLKFRQYPGPSRRSSITHAARAKAIPVGLEMKCLRTVLIWLHLNRYGEGAKALKVSLAHDRAPITPAMLEILLEAIDTEVSHDSRLKLFFRLVCGMGIRPKAALAIRHSHFSEGYRTLTVPEPMCSVFPVLQVPDSIRTILSELPIESDHGLIFPGNARAIHHRCQRLLSLALLKAGLDPGISFYRLRKMAA